ncbi:cysteine peptidase family C39 domain-containing protein [Nakamurella leprariae]|uniref:ATP-binding cassette domain-containing protein n=1 Tax=Nakamurella leprariae TaxID=2803911 RepID=A0A938Y8X5_9ACTN|nr:cysteine peptidase family C39 domain-containing protein [Nakamurella leprariae]MBM9466142.1 ATP-binding cassette domain-containing protein [Nakamurella leprariae]
MTRAATVPRGTPVGDAPASTPAEPAVPERIRVRCPTVLQMEAVECGAAALGIVLAHFGRWVGLEELRDAVGVSRDGSNARSVLRAGRAYGLQVKAFRRTPRTVRRTTVPFIVFWRMDHFLVVEGWKRGTWYLNDPASGPREVDDAEFDRSFSGIVLECTPGPEFEPGGRRPGLRRALLSRLQPFRWALLHVVLASLVLLVPGLAVPALSRAFVDGFLVGGRTGYLPVILGGMAAAAVVQLTMTWWQQRVINGLRTALTSGIFAAQTQRILRLSMRFFGQRAASDVAYRAGLGTAVAGLLSGPLVSALLSTTVAVVYLVVIVVISPVLGGIVLLAAAAVLLLLRWTGRRQRDLSTRQMRDQIDAAVVQSGSLNLIESIKAQGGEEQAVLTISAARSRLLAVRQRQDLALLPLTVIPTALTSLGTLALLSVGAVLVMQTDLSLGGLLAVQVLMGSVLAPLSLLAALGGQLEALSATAVRLQDVDRAAVDPEIAASLARSAGGATVRDRCERNSSEPDRVEPVRGRITLQQVDFGYAPLEPPLIRDLDLDLAPGSRVAVVGASGSGKSTVARLVAGLQQPTAGRVLVDGRPRSDWDRRLLTDGIGFVDQDVCLFEASIRDNITLWDPTVPDEAVVRAVADAGLTEVVTARPGGYDSLLGPSGLGLSGGQRQRVEIARALVRDPAVMVLDEATSALDTVTEQRIDLALRRRNCTCLIVAHRLSTVRDADEIVVLDAGVVVERGAHGELLALDGAYARLVRS